jgi:hypothetical protein
VSKSSSIRVPVKCVQNAFTLVEVLVSIFTISLLILLTTSSLSIARDNSRIVVCLSNQRQLGIGVSSYVTEFRKMPGMSESFGLYGRFTKWGTTPCYGAQVTQWGVYLDGTPDPETGNVISGPVGIGYVYPYLSGTGGYGVGPSGHNSGSKIWFCPGTPKSFDGDRAWYSNRWLHNDENLSGFGEEGRYAIGTYAWRGGAYAIDPTWSDDNGAWQSGDNWNSEPLSGQEAFLANKTMLTCYYPYNEQDTSSGEHKFSCSNMPHVGKTSNLLKTDGSARSWKLGGKLKPFSTATDTRILSPALFYTALANGAEPTDDQMYSSCAPWWWIKADRLDPN